MDCSICSSLPVILRPPRNTICGSCYDGAKCLINLINKLDYDHKSSVLLNKTTSNLVISPSISSKTPLTNASKWIIELKDREEELQQKINFLSEFVTAFQHQIHTDIQLNPGNAAPPIPAHRSLLAIRSEIFKNLLESDDYKSAPTDAITIPELNNEELESLLEFLYSGNLPEEKVEKHVYSLSMAADKYEIGYLQKFCESYMVKALGISNVLDVLEIADVCSLRELKERALNFIIKHMEEVVFLNGYEGFAMKNPHLSVEITRASLMDAKKNRSFDS